MVKRQLVVQGKSRRFLACIFGLMPHGWLCLHAAPGLAWMKFAEIEDVEAWAEGRAPKWHRSE